MIKSGEATKVMQPFQGSGMRMLYPSNGVHFATDFLLFVVFISLAVGSAGSFFSSLFI